MTLGARKFMPDVELLGKIEMKLKLLLVIIIIKNPPVKKLCSLARALYNIQYIINIAIKSLYVRVRTKITIKVDILNSKGFLRKVDGHILYFNCDICTRQINLQSLKLTLHNLWRY